jgi:hypothetical protein
MMDELQRLLQLEGLGKLKKKRVINLIGPRTLAGIHTQ